MAIDSKPATVGYGRDSDHGHLAGATDAERQRYADDLAAREEQRNAERAEEDAAKGYEPLPPAEQT